MQFKTATQLKNFITWAKSQKIAQLQVGDVQIVFSPLAFIDDVPNEFDAPKPKTEERTTAKTLLDDLKPDDDEDENLLYHSAL